jgi:hypothetical protein
MKSLAFVLLLTVTLICSLAYLAPGSVAAQSAPLSGSYGFLINASYADPSNNYGFALLGVMNFDGVGNITGSYTSEAGWLSPMAAKLFSWLRRAARAVAMRAELR